MIRLLLGLAVCLYGQETMPIPLTPEPLRAPLQQIREGKTTQARETLIRLLAGGKSDAEIYYQIARSHLLDFHENQDAAKARTSLALAMEALASALARNPDHLYALRSKAIIHARAELLYYDPNLAYDLAARVARLQPFANEYLLNLADWLSGEVRFTSHHEHRVPHDPLTGIDRSIAILDRVIDVSVPHSTEESIALFAMAKAQAKRGNLARSIDFFKMALRRPAERGELLREMGASFYRLGDYGEAARTFHQALQLRPNLIDQWLLKVSLDQWKDPPPPLPASALFPSMQPAFDKDNPPLIAFADMAPELGLNRKDGNGTCAWGDYDNDGRIDLLLAGSGTFLALYRNEGARFRDVTREAGLAGVPSGYSLNFVDYDNDGRLDIYLSLNGWSGPMPNRLYRNLGGRFQDVTAETGAGDPGSGFVSLWGDFDNDGHLDFAVANGVLKDGSVPQIYRNLGGKFQNVTHEAGIREPATYGAIGIALGDYDRDGDLDMFINGLGTAPNRLYRNMGGFRFQEVSRQAGVTQPPHNGFVSFFLDYNNDGYPDLLTTSLAPWENVVEGLSRHFRVPDPPAIHADSVRLFRNKGDGTFTDVTFQARLYHPMGVMGAGVADLDNDGHLDLYFGTGDPQLSRLEPNRFFRNNGDGTFSDLTALTPFARPGQKGHGVTFIDFDGDGGLDLYAQLGGHYPGDHAENAFYRNLKAKGNPWLQLDVERPETNRFAIGAGVLLKAGDLSLYREVKGSEGFGSTDPFTLHFGLGRRTIVDSVEIFWPGSPTQKLTGLKAGQRLRVRQAVVGSP